MNTSRDSLRGTGTQTAAIATGGISGPGVPADDETEEWDGSSWTEVADLNTARYSHNVTGTSTDALCGPGASPDPDFVDANEFWNGTSWTEGADINTARHDYGCGGVQVGGASAAALFWGGDPPSGASVALTEKYDGTSWTETSDLNTAREVGGGAGSASAGLAVGSNAIPTNTSTEEFDSAIVTYTPASFAEGNALNTARGFGGGAGIVTAALFTGGYSTPPATYHAITEEYNGTTWTEVADLNDARSAAAGAGTATAALMAAGRTSGPAHTDNSEEWNGTSWTEGDNTNTGRYSIQNRGAGTQTAALCVAGRERGGSAAYLTVNEEYNGSAWSEVTDYPTGTESGSGLGTQTAALVAGGYTGSYVTTAFEYDGTNWTAANAIPVASGGGSEAGTQTAGMILGIYSNPADTAVADTLQYDGTNFITDATLNTARNSGAGQKGGAGTVAAAFLAGGISGSTYRAHTEEYSGVTTVAEAADIAFD